jgi:hypothetical protein
VLTPTVAGVPAMLHRTGCTVLPTIRPSAIILPFDTRRWCLGEYKGEVS